MKNKWFVFNNLCNRLIIGFGNKYSVNGFYKMGDNIVYNVKCCNK